MPDAPDDGAYRWQIARAEPIFENGAILGWFGTNTDIDDQKHAEASVGELNRQLNLRLKDLETLLRVLPIGVAISHDPEARDIRMNEALAEMFGMSKADNGSLSAAIHRDSRPIARCRDDSEVPLDELVMQAAALSGEDQRDTYRVVRNDGTETQVLGFATPLKDGERRRGAIGAFVDVSEVKRAEQALLAAEGRYQAAGEAIPFGVWAADPDHTPTYLSQSFLDFLGLTLQDVREGRMAAQMVGGAEASHTTWAETVTNESESVFEMELRSGRTARSAPCLSRGRPIRDDHRVLTGYAGINLDITNRKQMERELANTVEELQKANAVKDELLGLVSHRAGGHR